MKKIIFEKKYYGFEDSYDLYRDISEALNPKYNENMKDIPGDFSGILNVVVTYIEEDQKCAICGKPITAYEVCEECAKTNDPFRHDSDKHEYLPGTRSI